MLDTANDVTFKIVRLGGAVGARIEGLDVRNIDDRTMAALRAAFHDHSVLVFPKQALTPSQLVAFTKRWGQPHISAGQHLDGHPEINQLGGLGARPFTDHWHTDHSADERPPMATILQAKTLPPSGGDTLFASQYLAFESLSPGMQQMLLPMRAMHSGETLYRLAGMDLDKAPKNLHPVVRSHPETGRKALFVNNAFTTHFENMTPEESRPLLEWLYRYCVQPNFTARVIWSVGDIAIWDNRCPQHFAIHDYGDEPRVMHRATVLGERPV